MSTYPIILLKKQWKTINLIHENLNVCTALEKAWYKLLERHSFQTVENIFCNEIYAENLRYEGMSAS